MELYPIFPPRPCHVKNNVTKFISQLIQHPVIDSLIGLTVTDPIRSEIPLHPFFFRFGSSSCQSPRAAPTVAEVQHKCVVSLTSLFQTAIFPPDADPNSLTPELTAACTSSSADRPPSKYFRPTL
jgi:hypothetical protein